MQDEDGESSGASARVLRGNGRMLQNGLFASALLAGDADKNIVVRDVVSSRTRPDSRPASRHSRHEPRWAAAAPGGG